MTKTRLFSVLLVNAALAYGSSRLVAAENQTLVAAWASSMAAAAFALVVSSWRAIRVLLLLIATGSLFLAAVGFSSSIAGAGLILVAFISVLALWAGWKSAPTWKKSSKYESAPQNPWTSLDRGIDPTE